MSCCRCTIPLGRPVEPEEYIQKAMSLRSVPAGASLSENPASQGVAATVPTASLGGGAPFTTTSLSNFVSLQTDSVNWSAKPASVIATVAPESER